MQRRGQAEEALKFAINSSKFDQGTENRTQTVTTNS